MISYVHLQALLSELRSCACGRKTNVSLRLKLSEKRNATLAKNWRTFPEEPWDWYIYLHEWLIFRGNVGKYTSPKDPRGLKELDVVCRHGVNQKYWVTKRLPVDSTPVSSVLLYHFIPSPKSQVTGLNPWIVIYAALVIGVNQQKNLWNHHLQGSSLKKKNKSKHCTILKEKSLQNNNTDMLLLACFILPKWVPFNVTKSLESLKKKMVVQGVQGMKSNAVE